MQQQINIQNLNINQSSDSIGVSQLQAEIERLMAQLKAYEYKMDLMANSIETYEVEKKEMQEEHEEVLMQMKVLQDKYAETARTL